MLGSGQGSGRQNLQLRGQAFSRRGGLISSLSRPLANEDPKGALGERSKMSSRATCSRASVVPGREALGADLAHRRPLGASQGMPWLDLRLSRFTLVFLQGKGLNGGADESSGGWCATEMVSVQRCSGGRTDRPE